MDTEIDVEEEGDMTLYDILNTALYYQDMSVYITNCYDQNLLIGRGTRAEMLDEREHGPAVFDHLLDEVDYWEINEKRRMLIFIRNENYNKRAEELFSNSKDWGREPESRPWRHSIETEKYTDEYIRIIYA